MLKLSSLFIATILAGSIGTTSVLAAEQTNTTMPSQTPAASPMTAAQKQEYDNMMQDAATMTGHIAIADIALMYGLTNEATDNTSQALVLAKKLEGETSKLNVEMIKLGKLKYRAANGQEHDYWLPIVNDAFVVNTLDSEYLKSKQPKAVEEDAQMVTTKIALDTKAVREALEKAQSSIKAMHYTDAQVALMNAAHSTFTDETISNMPLATAQDNLVLARNLTKLKDYDGAGFALNHAKEALGEYQKTAGKENSEKVEKLSADITGLQTEITKDKTSSTKTASSQDKPVSAIQNFENRFTNWIHTL